MRNDDRGNFEAWFVQPLKCLYPQVEPFGFIIVMVTLPLLERYLRQKEDIQTDLKQQFYIALEELFPDLSGQRDESRKFWKLCRHGLLHRGTFNASESHCIYLVRDLGEAVVVNRADPKNIVFKLDPVAFAQKVLTTILGDFETYATSKMSPLAVVSPLDETRDSSSSPATLPLGTGLPLNQGASSSQTGSLPISLS
jgi:hypothetical protein